MIFVTGGTHRLLDVEKLNKEHFPIQDKLNKEDYLIIAGDFGAVWDGGPRDKEALDYHANKHYTTLFVAGNHENHVLLNSYPVEEWNGGKIHRIRDDVIHLMNGQVFEINNRKIFIMGGATSIDKAYREAGKSWWEEEEPPFEVFEEGMENLKKYNNEVDYIITHTCPEIIRDDYMYKFEGYIDYESPVEKFLDVVLDNIRYKKWYLGHLHIDKEIPDFNMRILFDDIDRLL